MPHAPMSRAALPAGGDEFPRHRSQSDPRAARKAPGRCPLCGIKVGRIRSGTRHARHCGACGGTLNKDVTCPHCRTRRVWTGKRGRVCHGCGREVAVKVLSADSRSGG